MAARDIFSETLGIIIDEEEDGFVSGRLRVTEQHLNQHGTAHGGVIFALADAVFARASNRDGIPAVALDTSMTFTRAANTDDVLYAHCEELVRKRKIAVYSVRIMNSRRDLIAVFRGTVYRMDTAGAERPNKERH
ncbi:hotdog fold thioesterase [Sulfobacillus sp. hq2]|uniref:Phenylacetic acid degradation protein n=1 Tax=Sulfobacillus thermotolerans TaxID=338644 RepID=A0ABN5GZF7_9FIRM|nr:hotdog fold thioesterase [Sulfobacillus sp. hq2]AUW93823.1 phenylacetic acid degradation protein [Sulfobacillus thermotolerans]POB11364.1 phenylacetic acid degradation protein [Sulfobacillus sp. hq2]